MNYTEKITLEQALDLQKKIEKGEIPDMSACYRIDNRDIPVYSILDEGDLNTYNGGYYYITRPDYAQYIIGNKPLPDGYGYPSKDLSIGLYNGIPYMFCFGDQSNIWLSTGQVFNLKTTTITKWYEVAFKLTDLARVEAESDKPFADKYKEALAEPKPSLEHNEPYDVCIWYHDAHNIQEAIKKGTHQDILVVLNINPLETPFYISSRNINQLYGEHGQERYLLTTKSQYGKTVPKPSMPAHFEADWKAKYEAQAAELDEIRTRLRRSSDEVSERKEMLGELKLQLQEATASADSKQQTIEATTKVNNELGDCLRAARDYIEKLEQLGNTQTLLERHTKEKEFAQSAYYETLPF